MLYFLETFDSQNSFPIYHLSGSFYLYTTLAFLFLSVLPALTAFVSGEKISPFYIQKQVAYYFTCFVLLLGIFLFTNTLFHDGDFNVIVGLEDPVLLNDYQASLSIVDSSLNMFKASMVISYSRIGLLLFTFVAIVLSYEYLSSVRYNHFEFYMYVLLSTFAMLVLVSSNHALLTYLAIELQSLSLYLMASSYRKSIHSVEAGLKYVFIGSLASGALLIGFAMLYLATGTLDFSQAANVIQHLFSDSIQSSNNYKKLSLFVNSDTDSVLQQFSSIRENVDTSRLYFFFMPILEIVHSTSFYLYVSAGLIIFALLLKMAAAPFHTWLPDVYDGSPTSATTYFLLVPKIAIIVILYRFTHELFYWDQLSYLISDIEGLPLYEQQHVTTKNIPWKLFKNIPYCLKNEDVKCVAKLVDYSDRPRFNTMMEYMIDSNKRYSSSDTNSINYWNHDKISVLATESERFLPHRFQHIFAPAIILSILYSFVVGYSGLLKKGINLKRFFAFSSIGHLGFLLLPFSLNPDYIASSTLSAVSIYMFLYILATIPSIKVIMMFTSSKVFSAVGRKVHYSIDRLPPLFHIINPANALFVFVLFITFVGIPPTAGFFMKLYPLLGLMASPNPIVFFIWPVIVFSSYVYVRVLVSLFFSNFNEADPRAWVNICTSEGYLSTWLSSFSMLFLATYAFQIDIVEAIVMDMTL